MSRVTVVLYRWTLPNPRSRAATTSGRGRWFSSVRSCGLGRVESPSTTAVVGDQRHAAGNDLAEPVGFAIDDAARRGRLACEQQLGDELRLIAQVALDGGALPFLHLPRHQDGQCQQRQRGGGECPTNTFVRNPVFMPAAAH